MSLYGARLLHDNVSCHKAAIVRDFLKHEKWLSFPLILRIRQTRKDLGSAIFQCFHGIPKIAIKTLLNIESKDWNWVSPILGSAWKQCEWRYLLVNTFSKNGLNCITIWTQFVLRNIERNLTRHMSSYSRRQKKTRGKEKTSLLNVRNSILFSINLLEWKYIYEVFLCCCRIMHGLSFKY